MLIIIIRYVRTMFVSGSCTTVIYRAHKIMLPFGTSAAVSSLIESNSTVRSSFLYCIINNREIVIEVFYLLHYTCVLEVHTAKMPVHVVYSGETHCVP